VSERSVVQLKFRIKFSSVSVYYPLKLLLQLGKHTGHTKSKYHIHMPINNTNY